MGSEPPIIEPDAIDPKGFQIVLAVSGSRNYYDYRTIREYVEECIRKYRVGMIISGPDKGVDTCAKQIAKEFKIEHKEYEINWERDGAAARHRQQERMCLEANVFLLFCREGCTSTYGFIKKATHSGRIVHAFSVA